MRPFPPSLRPAGGPRPPQPAPQTRLRGRKGAADVARGRWRSRARHVHRLVVFALEVLMVGALGRYGLQQGSSTWAKYAYALLCPALVVVPWAYLAAPQAAHRLALPALALFRAGCFFLAAYALHQCHQAGLALALAAGALLTQAASGLWGD